MKYIDSVYTSVFTVQVRANSKGLASFLIAVSEERGGSFTCALSDGWSATEGEEQPASRALSRARSLLKGKDATT